MAGAGGLRPLSHNSHGGYVAANTIELPAAAGETLADHERQGWILLATLVLLQQADVGSVGLVTEPEDTP